MIIMIIIIITFFYIITQLKFITLSIRISGEDEEVYMVTF